MAGRHRRGAARDTDRANELIFRRIAEHIGFRLEARRDEAGLHLVFSKQAG